MINKKKNILVLGGSGFIGSNFVRCNVINKENNVLNIDKLTYAANNDSLLSISSNSNYKFLKGDICDANFIKNNISCFKPDQIVNFAAESHVDKSIYNHSEFIDSNIIGVYRLLEASIDYYKNLDEQKRTNFKFLHVSTDEVYGSLKLKDKRFTESTKYDPSSPYSASKAASDHLVMAWYKTYNLPVLITNCSNNYGPYQFPEKLIPLIIINCLMEKDLPVYGTGKNIRDWIHVLDHCKAIMEILENGKIGHSYNIGSEHELTNLDIINKVCKIMDCKIPRKHNLLYNQLITFVKDRAGHDFRYAINNSKVKEHTGWLPSISFDRGIEDTINWYIKNKNWWINKVNK